MSNCQIPFYQVSTWWYPKECNRFYLKNTKQEERSLKMSGRGQGSGKCPWFHCCLLWLYLEICYDIYTTKDLKSPTVKETRVLNQMLLKHIWLQTFALHFIISFFLLTIHILKKTGNVRYHCRNLLIYGIFKKRRGGGLLKNKTVWLLSEAGSGRWTKWWKGSNDTNFQL